MSETFNDQLTSKKNDLPQGSKLRSSILPNSFFENDNSIEKFNNLLAIIENFESSDPFYDTLKFIYQSFSSYVPYSHIGVALIDKCNTTIRGSYCVTSKKHPNIAKRLTGYRTELKNTSLIKLLENGSPRIINDLEGYLRGREIHKYNKILLDNGIRSSITFPFIKKNVPVGTIFFSSDQKNVFTSDHVKFLQVLANSIMLSLNRKIMLDDIVVSSTLALASLAEEHDNETGKHLERMKKYSVLLAELVSQNKGFSIDVDYLDNIERFSPLHDIGKVAISDSILLKPGKLTPAEFNIMKTHTTYGGKVLRLADDNVKKYSQGIFGMGIDICEGHHERWDGKGYPFGRNGENIPLSARIVTVADVLDALTSKRPYKEPFSFESSVAMILEESGTHFDPRIIEVFKDNIAEFKELYLRFNRP